MGAEMEPAVIEAFVARIEQRLVERVDRNEHALKREPSRHLGRPRRPRGDRGRFSSPALTRLSRSGPDAARKGRC
jgi:hypothetical protein